MNRNYAQRLYNNHVKHDGIDTEPAIKYNEFEHYASLGLSLPPFETFSKKAKEAYQIAKSDYERKISKVHHGFNVGLNEQAVSSALRHYPSYENYLMQKAQTTTGLRGNGLKASYCLRCKKPTTGQQHHDVITSNNRTIEKSKCDDCGVTKCKFVK